MLKNHSIVENYQYDINLIKPIQYLCQLAYDILSITTSSPSVNVLFKEAYLEEIKLDISKLPATVTGRDAVSWLANHISQYYGEYIFGKLDYTKTSILLLHQPSRILYVLNKQNRQLNKDARNNADDKKSSIKNALLRLIKELELIKVIADNLVDVRIRNCIQNSLLLDSDEVFYGCVTIKDNAIPFDVPYFEYEYLNTALTKKDLLEVDDIWVNKAKFKEALKIEIGTSNEVSIVKSNSNVDIGILYNNFVFPIKHNLSEYIIEDRKADFYWIQIKEVYKVNDNKGSYSSDLISSFISHIKQKEFTDLLSFLKENLYIDSELLNQPDRLKYKKYFTSSLKIEEVKYLKKLNFFIGDTGNPASFGIYSFEKLAEDALHYNLIHWFDRDDQGRNFKYRDNLGPKTMKEVYKVSTLKPEIAYYYITKYFEDYVQILLDELNVHYISNFHLFNIEQPLGEFDFLIKTSTSFYFLEVKTTLNKYYIKDYIAKCQKVIDSFKHIDVNIEFIILGAYSNATIEDLKHYILNFHNRFKRYNKVSPELNSVPYYFRIPIDSTDKQMYCIAESNFSLLKNLLKKCLK